MIIFIIWNGIVGINWNSYFNNYYYKNVCWWLGTEFKRGSWGLFVLFVPRLPLLAAGTRKERSGGRVATPARRPRGQCFVSRWFLCANVLSERRQRCRKRLEWPSAPGFEEELGLEAWAGGVRQAQRELQWSARISLEGQSVATFWLFHPTVPSLCLALVFPVLRWEPSLLWCTMMNTFRFNFWKFPIICLLRTNLITCWLHGVRQCAVVTIFAPETQWSF